MSFAEASKERVNLQRNQPVGVLAVRSFKGGDRRINFADRGVDPRLETRIDGPLSGQILETLELGERLSSIALNPIAVTEGPRVARGRKVPASSPR